MTLQSEDMGKLVAGNLGRVWLLKWLRDIMRDFRPAHREAQPETDGGGEVEAVAAARAYFEGWMQDEAADEGPEWTGCSKEQHLAAKRLKEALAALASKGV